MIFKYADGSRVRYILGEIRGEGVVVGVSDSVTAATTMGAEYLVKDPSIKSETYPYEVFVVPEIALMAIQDDIPPPPTPESTQRTLREGKPVPTFNPPPTPPSSKAMHEGWRDR